MISEVHWYLEVLLLIVRYIYRVIQKEWTDFMTHCFSSQASSWNESVTIWKRSFLSFEWLSQGRCSCIVPPATFSCLFTLGMASPQQKTFCVLEFAKTNSVVMVQRAFRRRFDINPPSPKNIRRWFRQFQESGCLCKGKSPGRPRVSEEFSYCIDVARAAGGGHIEHL